MNIHSNIELREGETAHQKERAIRRVFTNAADDGTIEFKWDSPEKRANVTISMIQVKSANDFTTLMQMLGGNTEIRKTA